MVTVEEFNDADDDLYALLGVPATATVEEIRNGYKEKALLHHPDRGGDPFAWTRIAQAYDTLNGPRRAAYDKTRRVATGGAESEFAQSFGDGAFDLTEGKAPAERKAEKASIVEQLAQVKEDEAQRGTVSTASADGMSHSAGFDAWLRNQRGLGMHGSYTAEDLLRKNKGLGGGIEATDGSAVRLPPLSALAVSFSEHGAPEEVSPEPPPRRAACCRALPRAAVLCRVLLCSAVCLPGQRRSPCFLCLVGALAGGGAGPAWRARARRGERTRPRTLQPHPPQPATPRAPPRTPAHRRYCTPRSPTPPSLPHPALPRYCTPRTAPHVLHPSLPHPAHRRCWCTGSRAACTRTTWCACAAR